MLTKLLKSDRWSSFINNKTEITNNEVTHDDVLNHAAASLLRSADNRLESSQLFYLILLPFYCSHLSLPLATYTLCHRLNDKNSKRSLVYADCLLLCNCYVMLRSIREVSGNSTLSGEWSPLLQNNGKQWYSCLSACHLLAWDGTDGKQTSRNTIVYHYSVARVTTLQTDCLLLCNCSVITSLLTLFSPTT